ncbi:MAG: recombinase RecJ, partial [Gracilibacteraceae bacterium]|nr:recombinase RecJ [Gracilibacteraceae bacterium]
VDCQYGAGNVTKFPAATVFVLDHHRQEKAEFTDGIIRPQLGSCSTLIWDLLRKEGFDFAAGADVATALYYGLYTDTSSLSEISHPLDKDMRDTLAYNQNILKKLKNSNLSFEELTLAGSALTQCKTDPELRYALLAAGPCDPNILGFISDLALQVNGIDLCVVHSAVQNGVKLSVRTCVRELMASECAEFITEGVGSGGGHREKAGGFILRSSLDNLNTGADEFLERRVREYLTAYDVIDAAHHTLDVAAMPEYTKKKIPVLFVLSADIFAPGTPILIRTLEGDAEAVASDDVFLIIGMLGEVYPIRRDKFQKSYATLDKTQKNSCEYEYSYSPTAINKVTGDSVELFPHASPCVALGEAVIRAVPLKRRVKVLTAWNPEGYMSGKPGDFLAVRRDDHSDVYIIRRDIFFKTYEAS